MIITCYSLERYGFWDTNDCCVSCHEDQNEYGYDLMHLGDFNETPVLANWSDVCCAVTTSSKVKFRIKMLLSCNQSFKCGEWVLC